MNLCRTEILKGQETAAALQWRLYPAFPAQAAIKKLSIIAFQHCFL